VFVFFPKSPYRLAQRVALAGLLFATVVVVPSTSAQPIDQDAIEAKQELLVPQQDVYPRSDTPVQIKVGQHTHNVRPLLKVQTAGGHEAVADRLLVGFTPFVSAAEMADIHSAAARAGAGRARPVLHIGAKTYLVDVSGAVSLETAARAYEFPGKVRFAGPDLVAHATEEPDDDLYDQQWGMDKIQAPTAWNRTHGATHRKIAILDSGINSVGLDAHVDLAGKVIVGKDFTDSPFGADDVLGHGTHVAGIAAAVTDNAEGVAGAGWDSRLINAKVLDDNDDSSASLIASGIRWAVDSGADVINISIGWSADCDPGIFDGGFHAMRDAINHAWSKNVLVVASAGNKGDSKERAPASCPNVLAVANTTQTDALADKSSRGTWVELAAPGTTIRSTAVEGAKKCGAAATDDPPYADCNGTSMAAPHVAGVAALVQASCFLDTNVQAVYDQLTSTADQIPGTGDNFKYGRLNAAKAVCFPTPGNPRIGTVTPSSIQVRWDDVTPGETRFDVEHRPNGGSTTISSVAANAESFTHTGVTPGVVYRYRVRACDSVDCSPWSIAITATAAFHQLTVQTTASQVTSTPGGIRCGLGEFDCKQFYAPGTVVTLHAPSHLNEQEGYMFELEKWEGDCSGLGCVVTMNGPKSVKAVYKKVDLPGQPCPEDLPNCQIP
jgi:thermitase